MTPAVSIKLGVSPTIIHTTRIPRITVSNQESSSPIDNKRKRCNKSLKVVKKNRRKVRKIMAEHKDR